MVRVRDLRDQISASPYHGSTPLLYCYGCGSEFSANSGDYFMASPDHVFMCCGMEMELVTKEVTYIPIT